MKTTNKHNLPDAFVEVVTGNIYDPSKSDPNRISVTTLINPPITRYLTVRHWAELEEDVSDHIWRIFGTAIHYILSTIKKDNRLIEEKFTAEVDGITVVGKLDLYEALTKTIEDYKVTSVWSILFGDPKDYEKQINCYAWLLRQKGIPVEQAYINAILKDWKKTENKNNDNYPPIPFARIKVKVWSNEEQDSYIKERVALYKSVMNLPDNELPICSEEERWAKPDTYAVMKNKNKRATRVLDTLEKAQTYAIDIGLKDVKSKYNVVKRPGSDMKCSNYCLPCRFCHYYKEKYS